MTYRRVRDLSIEEIGAARADYFAGTHVRAAAGQLGISTPAYYRLIRGLDCPLRSDIAREARAAELLAKAGVPDAEIDAGGSLAAAAKVLERRTVEQLLLLQRRAADAPAGIKGEIIAKAIAHQSRG